MGGAGCLKIMVLQLWVSVKILALWAQFFDVTHARANFSHDDTETGPSYPLSLFKTI